jgi:3'-phosphoadenosine 5'-phosphosulfate sulfotransferase (PAPS reductase)/FAD synthetase
VQKLGLAFSSGKDSLACLFLNLKRLHEITVFYVNTGKAYPESLQIVEMVKALAPHFVEVRSDRDSQNAANGLPADVVPINWTTMGQIVTGKKSVTIQSYLGCCYENIAAPLHEAALAHGITHMIRGQRSDEGHRSSARDGDSYGGITYLHPIESWTKAEVLEFVSRHMKLPEHFSLEQTSLDCYDCTAYAAQSHDRIAYTKARHPSLHAEYKTRHDALKEALMESISGYQYA